MHPLLRVLLYVPPSSRRALVGTALMMERAPRAGWFGAVLDLLRVLAGAPAALLATLGGGGPTTLSAAGAAGTAQHC